MKTNEYRDLLLHMEWADASIWGEALSVPALARDQWMRERLYHYHCTQRAYLQIFQRRPMQIPELGSLLDLRAVGLWARQFYRELPAFREALDEASLQANVAFPFAAEVAKRYGSAGAATVGESIVQLALHSAHHRGQVAVRLRESGGVPPTIDFIAWVWMLRPAPQWKELDV